MQFIGHEEGRIRFNSANSSLQYDYFIKDHLGNVRMVLTEEQKTDMYPAATMEMASATTEESFYSNLPATRVDAPTGSGYPADTPPGNAKVAKVNGNGNKIGPAIILKVMAGDKINISFPDECHPVTCEQAADSSSSNPTNVYLIICNFQKNRKWNSGF